MYMYIYNHACTCTCIYTIIHVHVHVSHFIGTSNYAFVEFYTTDDSAKWLSANKVSPYIILTRLCMVIVHVYIHVHIHVHACNELLSFRMVLK